jgi:hypothetical protein
MFTTLSVLCAYATTYFTRREWVLLPEALAAWLCSHEKWRGAGQRSSRSSGLVHPWVVPGASVYEGRQGRPLGASVWQRLKGRGHEVASLGWAG